MRSALIVAGLLALAPVAPASAAVGVSIGINIPVYPRLVAVPGYPVYYAPGVDSNTARSTSGGPNSNKLPLKPAIKPTLMPGWVRPFTTMAQF